MFYVYFSAAASVNYDKNAETVCLEFRSELGVGDAVIFINYSGTINDKMRGFYRTKYTIDGEERYAAITQFEVKHSHIYVAGMTFPFWCTCRLLRLGGLCLVGMNLLTKLHMMWSLLFPRTRLLSPIW